MKNRYRISPSIGQSIVAMTLGIVISVLVVSNIVYFSIFTSRTERLIETQSREITKQIILNYENYIASIMETANYIQTASHSLDIATDFEEMQNLYYLNSQLKKDVVSIFLFDDEGSRIMGDEIATLHLNLIREYPWFYNALDEPSIFHFIANSSDSIGLNRFDEVISVSKQISYTAEGQREIGVLVIELNFQVIRNLAVMTELGKGGHILILDDDDSLIYTSEEPHELTSQSFPVAMDQVLGGSLTAIGGHQLFLNLNTLGHTRWRIATFTNMDELVETRKDLVRMMLLIFTAVMAVTVSIASFLSARITRPIHQLQNIMMRIEEGEINTRVDVHGQKEIVMLGRSFNSMIEQVRELMDRLVGEQREKRKTELRALQNQINPHFLYNSLDSIVWLAEHNRSDDVITAVVALARFFRISISRGATFIPVSDEISHVRNYLTIQSIRYTGKFEYTFNVDKGLMKRKVMKLILQPLVENAIHHGIEDEGGSISIQGRESEGFMVFEVKNSGYGLTDGRIEEIHALLEGKTGNSESGIGVGLKNVYQRLKLYYGDAADLVFSSVPDESTIVTVRIPGDPQESRG